MAKMSGSISRKGLAFRKGVAFTVYYSKYSCSQRASPTNLFPILSNYKRGYNAPMTIINDFFEL